MMSGDRRRIVITRGRALLGTDVQGVSLSLLYLFFHLPSSVIDNVYLVGLSDRDRAVVLVSTAAVGDPRGQDQI